MEESNASNEAEKEQNEEAFQPKKVDMRKWVSDNSKIERLIKQQLSRYKRDYYINDPSEVQKRYSGGSNTSKSASFDVDDDVSDEHINGNLHNEHHERNFLLEKLLNSNFDSASVTSRNSRDSSERDFTIPREILKQLESQMLHADLKRESFRARTGTKNFCLNPLFEEGFGLKSNDAENGSNFERKSHRAQRARTRPSTASSVSSLDELKANCVENIFMDLNHVRRSGSVKSFDSDRPSFAAERCHSLKGAERKLKWAL